MGDLLVLSVLILIIILILKKLIRPYRKGQGEIICVGCSSNSCSNCDPIALKENLKKELHSNGCH